MPSFSLYKTMHSAPITAGEMRKKQADQIMDVTWWEDINSRVGYLYDCYHDDEPLVLRGLNPTKSKDKIAVDVKLIKHTSKTYEKDAVTYHLQFRPYYDDVPDWYTKNFIDMYRSTFPMGCYIDLQDSKGNYNRWLIVDEVNLYGTQFITWEILPCDYIFQWMMDGKKHQLAGVKRSQNSYMLCAS